MTTVLCSGLQSAGEQAPGVGVALSLRDAFPDLHIVAVAGSARTAGLHHPAFDDVWITSDVPAILGRLDADGLWIAGSDREARLLAEVADARVLSPSSGALERLDGDELAGSLGLLAPATISAREDDWRLSAFGREHGWRLWLRGPALAPRRIDGWSGLERVRAHLGDAWSAGRLRLHAHIEGNAESIAFAAHGGRLLGAAHMRTAIAAADGSAAGGFVASLADALDGVASALERELSGTAWTGGGAIELVRSVDGTAWLVDVHPHFPSWVHAATLAGENLPAGLVGATGRRIAASAEPRSSEFVRVVVEIPVRPGVPLPEPVAAMTGVVRAGNYLSGMPDPGRRRSPDGGSQPREAAVDPPASLGTVVEALRSARSTPHTHRIDPSSRWRDALGRIHAAAGSCRVETAYSIKTDPDRELLAAARSYGFLAEAITGAEMRAALAAGFESESIILNGPAKRWPPSTTPVVTYATFADSLGELAGLARLTRSGQLAARYLGPRLRPPSVASRFGVEVGDFRTFEGLVATLRELPAGQPVGVHFHWASSEAGHETWFQTVETTLEWCVCLQVASDRAVRCLDLGGGWQPDDFDAVLLARLPELVARCRERLDALEVVVLEPGRALVQPLAVVETTVLEVRERDAAREIVVDASLAEVPRAGVYPHRILGRSGGRWHAWGRGPDRVLGRLCMENDVLRVGIAVPDELRAGDRVLLADAGAYDRSMAYRFGRG